MNAPLASLSDEELGAVRRALRVLAEKMRATARLRRRRRARGRIDPRRLLRAALRTGGVPLALPRQDRRRALPRLVVLCDVSDSVRPVSALLLELTRALHELFESSRSFAFVSELVETTRVFQRSSATHSPTELAARAGLAIGGGNSNYGRMLRDFEAMVKGSLDRRTMVVILGDGRSNYHDPAAEVLGRVRSRARALIWLCPEPRSRWGEGDSAMHRYAPMCTAALAIRNAFDLEHAVRALYGASVGG